MAIMDERYTKNDGAEQNVIIEGRRRISVSGVDEVDSFDERDMVLQTSMGVLSIKGADLHINKFNVETGELVIDGDVDEVVYRDGGEFGKKSSFFAKMFG